MGRGVAGRTGDWIRASSPDFIVDSDLRRLYDYWRSKRQGRLMPAMPDIDPLDIPWALSRIYLVDCTAEGDCVYRLAGNDIASVFGRANLKGLRPRDFLPAERAAPVEQLFRKVVDEGCIMWMQGLIYLRADRTPLGERLFLPLSDTGGDRATGVLGMTVVHSATYGPGDPLNLARDIYLPVSDLA